MPKPTFWKGWSEGPRGAADGPVRTKCWLSLCSVQVPWLSQEGRASSTALHPQPGPCCGAQHCRVGRILQQQPRDRKKSQSFPKLDEMAPPYTVEDRKITTSVPRSTSAPLNVWWDTGNTTSSAAEGSWTKLLENGETRVI